MDKFIFLFVIVFIHVVYPQECGKDFGDLNPEEGTANLKQYPSLAHIISRHDNGPERSLGRAVLISPNYLLTSAVNVVQKNYELTGIVLGEQNLKTVAACCADENIQKCAKTLIKVGIDKVIVHPDYSDKNYNNDIAIIKLKDKVSFTEYIQPICLPKQNQKIEDGELLHFATYNTIGPFKGLEKGNARTLLLPVRNFEECSKNISTLIHNNNIDWNGDREMCAGSEDRDGCTGDGGAPLMKLNENNQWTAIGILSFGPNHCGMANFPSVYTKISGYLDWILSTAELK